MSKCGTHAGFQAHRKAGVEVCAPCRAARNEYMRDLREQRARGVDGPLNQSELIIEAEWLLNLRQGEQRILAALGYTGREGTLSRRLRAAGRGDLTPRIFELTA